MELAQAYHHLAELHDTLGGLGFELRLGLGFPIDQVLIPFLDTQWGFGKAGNGRFTTEKSINCNLMEQVKETAKGQAPYAAIVGCIDSRVPPELMRHDLDTFLRKIIDASLEEKSSHVIKVRERIAASLACQAAIKVHRPLSGEEMARVVAELLQSSNPYACPHGRPIIVDIKHLDIERHFHERATSTCILDRGGKSLFIRHAASSSFPNQTTCFR